MTIKELSKLTGVSEYTLRYYDDKKVGLNLLNPAKDDLEYRDYTEEDVSKVIQISLFKSLGLKLKEIGTIFDDKKNTDSCYDDIVERLAKKKEEIERQITFIKYIKMMGIQSFIETISFLAKGNDNKKIKTDELITKYIEWIVTDDLKVIMQDMPTDRAKGTAQKLEKFLAKINSFRTNNISKDSPEVIEALDEFANIIVEAEGAEGFTDKNLPNVMLNLLQRKDALHDDIEERYPGISEYIISLFGEDYWTIILDDVYQHIEKFVPLVGTSVKDAKIFELTRELFRCVCEYGFYKNVEQKKLAMIPFCRYVLTEQYLPLALEDETLYPQATKLAIKAFDLYKDDESFLL